MIVDLTKANIKHLSIHAENNTIHISIGEKLRTLTLSGCLENIDLIECTGIPNLSFYLDCTKTNKPTYQLPIYKALKKAVSIDINNSPLGPAFDCTSLLQFPNLINLNLRGNMTNLNILTAFEQLERLSLRFVPSLENIPKLISFKHLKSFIGYNIEETSGKALRTELNKLLKEKEMDYSGVTKLRKKIWFHTEYGIPFSGWEDKNAKIATKAYKDCLNQVKKCKTEKELQEAMITFLKIINQLEGIVTSEREDVGTAICHFADSSSFEVPQEKWQIWFDEVRDF